MPLLSAGLLAYRSVDNGVLEVLLVHPGGPLWKNKDDHAWSVPKGEYEEGADPLAEAKREFVEELGVALPPGPWLDLGVVRQSGGKLVNVWAVEADHLEIECPMSNEFEMEWPPRSGQLKTFPEVDRAEWMTLSEALPRINNAQGEFLERLRNALHTNSRQNAHMPR
jgi:predicted NUDIX family NTP pyrophosphohydrolase